MRRTIIFSMILASLILAAAFAVAGPQAPVHSISLPETRVELAPGDGKVKVETFCNICHSLDYITMQPKFSRAQWTGTVNKMVKVFGAPINEEDSKMIIDYLVAQYGAGN
ncbi:MAG: cytochrome c [Nitrospirae bacterium]|nr:cytochrome c [Nitrospirota bacterium]MCL5422295.1 cytochrome c [Nitrospirota bacterium]